MNIDKLKEEKKQLEQQREQTIASIQQLTGAIAMVEKLINDLLKEEESDKENNKEQELKQAA